MGRRGRKPRPLGYAPEQQHWTERGYPDMPAPAPPGPLGLHPEVLVAALQAATGPASAASVGTFAQAVPPAAMGHPAAPLVLPLAPRPPLLEMSADGQTALRLWAISPLGLPSTPPALPSLPPFLLPSADSEANLPQSDQASINRRTPPKLVAGGGTGPADWTPVAEQEQQVDRRKFFHCEGKEHSFRATEASLKASHADSLHYEAGQRLVLPVDEIHFGNPRVRIMQGAPAPMPQMLKWPQEKFEEHDLECAQISFGGEYMVWCANGIPANRLLYAMKRCKVEQAQVIVVSPPPVLDMSEDIDLTYGVSIQGIQLVP